MKKFSALIMALMVFMVSVTGVLAVEGAAEGTALTSQSYTGIDNDNGVKEVAQIKQTVNVEIQNLQNARIRAQKDYDGVKKETVSIRTNMIQKRSELNKCDSDNADCAELRTQARIASGDYLENLANMLIKHLEQVQIRIKLSEQITNEEEIKLIDIIGERKGRLESVKDEIQRLKNGENSEISSRQEIVKKLRNEVKDAKTFLRKISVHVEARQIEELILQQKQAGDKIQRILVEMETDDETYEDVSALLEIFNENLDEATKYIELAMENPEEPITTEIKNYDPTRDYLRRAKNEIKESYITLHKIVRMIREDNQEISSGNNDPSEISDSAPELNNGEEEAEEETGYKLSVAIGETESIDIDIESISVDGISCNSLSASSMNALNCNIADENSHLSFMVEEYVTGYAGLINVDVSVSETASEGACFCELVSYDGETKELTIAVVSASEISNAGPSTLSNNAEDSA